MNDREEAAQNDQGAAKVQVQLTGCPPEDAHTVFTALDTLFVSDRTKDDAPRELEGAGAAVWAATVDVSDGAAEAAPCRLTGSVSVTVQGSYWAADRLRAGLGSAFTVQEVGSTSGDQEQEIQLRLDNREA
ncbi:hypothetical protein [Streptomyces decoyicus]|uniref:hypothetical protein n=1 Tax=Streptomyces decoyicus TaxID=249567 RepID=UPI0004AA07E3|nr:hypothetical protein [Streptomyces decoyicus]KOG42264.1 hypothetical protein ADK74_16815 [Streptomyces decoyicus]QZY13947.1 hypothetical protein K7C20_00610 [Streptomyces decoyicus]